MEDVSKFPYVLSCLLQANKIRPADLARSVGTSVEHIEFLLRGTMTPSAALLHAISDELHVAYAALVDLVNSDRAMRLHRRATELRRKSAVDAV